MNRLKRWSVWLGVGIFLCTVSLFGAEKELFPGGQLRAIWCDPPTETDEAAGLAKMDEMLDHVVSGGFNALFLWGASDYLWAVTEGGDALAESPTAHYDPYGKMIERAKERGVAVHLWYSPWIYKNVERAIETRRHPEWLAVNIEGKTDTDGICLNRPEVRQFEIDLLRKVILRYPDLAGIHIEEPGYNWGDYCYCDHCRTLFRALTGIEVTDDIDSRQKIKEEFHNFNAAFSSDFMIRLRAVMKEENPNLLFSTNGSPGVNSDWKLGRDWAGWAAHGVIDFYVPQIYTEDVTAFSQGAVQTKKTLGRCVLVPGFAISWSSIYPKRLTKETLEGLVDAAQAAQGKGYVVFHYNHFEPIHFETFDSIRAKTQTKEN